MTSAAREEDRQRARQVADAVLYEGYVLFPYRASATKNRFRWQWGVVVPEQQRALGHAEQSSVTCAVLVRSGGPASGVEVAARFLRLQHRQMVDADGDDVERLEVGGTAIPTWDEGIEQEISPAAVALDGAGASGEPVVHVVDLPGDREVDSHGRAGDAVRTTQPLHGEIRIGCEQMDEHVRKLTVTIANTTGWAQPRAARDEVLLRSLVGVHVLLEATGGAEIASAIDPPGWAAPWEHLRASRGLYPVLAGAPPRTEDGDPRTGTLSLALPIILSDFPEIAPESVGQSFDATEVDELLALCVLGLSDEEKAEARATDPRAAELLDRIGALPPAGMERLHGTVRSRSQADPGLLPDPQVQLSPEAVAALGVGEAPLDALSIGSVVVQVGSLVRLRPRRRADAQDLFLDGQIGRIERIVTTDDGERQVAVTLELDPAAELHRWYGRYHYFGSDEIEPVAAASGSGAGGGRDG